MTRYPDTRYLDKLDSWTFGCQDIEFVSIYGVPKQEYHCSIGCWHNLSLVDKMILGQHSHNLISKYVCCVHFLNLSLFIVT